MVNVSVNDVVVSVSSSSCEYVFVLEMTLLQLAVVAVVVLLIEDDYSRAIYWEMITVYAAVYPTFYQ